MKLVRATLTKLVTDDGFVKVKDGVTLGRVYVVDVQSRRMVTLFDEPSKTIHQKAIYTCYRAERGRIIPSGYVAEELITPEEPDAAKIP